MAFSGHLKSLVPQKIKSAARVILGEADGKRRVHIIAHPYTTMPVIPHLVVPDFKADDADVRNADRLLKAYRLATREHQSSEADLWMLNENNQKYFLSLLQENDPVKLAQYLCNMNRKDATIGTVQGDIEYNRIIRDSKYRSFLALMAKDKLVSLAEALGVLPVENPEQGKYGGHLYTDAAELAQKISNVIGIDIVPPPIDGGLLKIIAGNALFNERDCNAIYTAHMIRAANNICEIGGGAGRVAYWCNRFGVSNYTMIDLPRINVIQGFYLLKSLPGCVSLFGEPERAIKILPCHSLPTDKYDLVINQDSFPEIGKETVLSYLAWIRLNTNNFLSINHESKTPYNGGQHISVSELVKETGGINLKQRYPYWLRKGYVMEWYQVEREAAGVSKG